MNISTIPSPATPQLSSPVTVPFDGSRATWFTFASNQAHPWKGTQREHLVGVNSSTGPFFASLEDAIAAAQEQSHASAPAVAVLQATPTTWGVYQTYAQTSVSVPDNTALGYHFVHGIPEQFAFEGVSFHPGNLAFAPLVGALVDGSSVWKPSFPSTT